MTTNAKNERKITSTLVITTISVQVAILSSFTHGYFKYHEKILNVPNLVSAQDRLVYTLRLQVFSMIPFWFLIRYVIHGRIFSEAINPMSGNEHLVAMGNNILRNTLEQFLFASVNQLILATHLPPDYLHVIPFLVFFFTFGRILFFLGYRIHPYYRSTGFVCTLLPSTLAFFANIAYASGMFSSILPSAASSNVTLHATL